MQRRSLLKRLLQLSGGFIGANLLVGGCEPQGRSPNLMFMLDLLDSATPLPDHLVIPVGEFYVQSYGLPVAVDAQQWRLEIGGAVEQPLTLTLDDILAAPQDDFYLTMECIGNPAGGDQIGNALWRGTALLPFLQRAKVKPEATDWLMHGADYYETNLPVAALLRPEVRLVHQMNQAPLTKEHGYPVRLIVPGRFGQKQPKWLVKLEAIAQSKRGYWERQGWSNTAEIPTHGMIRQVQGDRVWHRRHTVTLAKTGDRGWSRGILVAGIALDQQRPIQAVEVSTDGGQTWHQADHNRPPSPHEWTLWRYAWRPENPGRYTLLARAKTAGSTQPLEDAERQDGSAGVLKIDVTLTA